ncbi:hypothetical protein Tco_1204726 [Tanacetum coccineum]
MRVRLWIQQRHELPCASRKFQGIGCAMIGGEGDGVSNWTSSGVFGERGDVDDVGDLGIWKNDGYYNGGNLPGTYIIGNQLHYQDLKWYEALEDCEVKDKALRKKAIGDGFINDDDESRCELKRRWNIYTNYDDAYEINHEDNKSKELCEVHELSVCNVRKYMMIKYSFNNNEVYVAVKEDEYDDLTITRKEACQVYQEIFRIMDKGWMVTRAT